MFLTYNSQPDNGQINTIHSTQASYYNNPFSQQIGNDIPIYQQQFILKNQTDYYQHSIPSNFLSQNPISQEKGNIDNAYGIQQPKLPQYYQNTFNLASQQQILPPQTSYNNLTAHTANISNQQQFNNMQPYQYNATANYSVYNIPRDFSNSSATQNPVLSQEANIQSHQLLSYNAPLISSTYPSNASQIPYNQNIEPDPLTIKDPHTQKMTEYTRSNHNIDQSLINDKNKNEINDRDFPQVSQSVVLQQTPNPVSYQMIHPSLISDYDKLIKNKQDSYFEKILLTNNGVGFRKSLILDEPPKFFNPFVPNYGNNNLCYNPYYTNDAQKIGLNLNGYLLRRFKSINLEEDLKFFSNKEKKIFNFNNFIKLFLYFTIPVNLFYYFKFKGKKFLFFTFFNLFLLPHTNNIEKFVFYNSYIRNFNGYNDEQVDYILTCNQSKINKLQTYHNTNNVSTNISTPPSESKSNL